MESIARFIMSTLNEFVYGSSAPSKCGSFYDFNKDHAKYKIFLKEELEKSDILREAWAKAEKSKKAHEDLTEEEVIAIVAYTSTLDEPNFYEEFNNQVCDLGPKNANFSFKALHFFLHSASNKLSKKRSHRKRHVYRGVAMDVNIKIGEPYHFAKFASTSFKHEVAVGFGTRIRKGCAIPDTDVMIFDIEDTNKGAEIAEITVFAGEEEVLFPPCEQFIVTDVSVKDDVVWNVSG